MVVCAAAAVRIGIAAFFGNIVAWPVRLVLTITKCLAAVPLAAVYTKSVYIVLWLVFAYVLLAVFLLVRRKPVALFGFLVAFGLCLSVTVSWAEPLLDRCRVTALDVGQGQAILLQSGGKTFLVDCGGDYSEDAADITADTLLSQGIGRLDGIILTHYDEDHAGGIAYLLERIDTDLLLLPYIEDEQKVGSGLAQQAGERAYFVSEDLEITYDSTKLSVFAPLIFDSDNESCISVLFQTENCDILITGDRSRKGELRLLQRVELPELELLVAGHHGSKNATSDSLLKLTSPEYVFISAGQNNRYGHPNQAVLERLEEYGCTVYRTDQQGTLIFRR